MKHVVLGLAVSLSTATAAAQKPCEELGAEISAKLEAKGVKGYTLKLVPATEVKDQTVVGSCANGATKLVYRRL